jgi:hypothetical protein
MGSLLRLTATVSPGDIGSLAVIILVEVADAALIAVTAGPVDLSRGRARQTQISPSG